MRMRALGLLVFLLLLFSNISQAQVAAPAVTPYFCTAGAFNPPFGINSTGADLGLALIALTISFDVVAIAFALSRLFPNMGIRSWLQQEYWELAKTAIIIVVIYASIVLVGNLSFYISPQTVTSTLSYSGAGKISITPLIVGAESYLCGVNTNLYNTWQEIGIMGGGTGFWASFHVSFYIPIPTPWVVLYDGINFLPFSNWMLQTGNYMIAWYGSIINDLVNFILFPYTSIVIGLISTLPSLAYVGLTFFIPLGLAFRALPFIRGIGGTLIAVGLALCLILPSTLILFNGIATSMLSAAIPIIQPAPYVPYTTNYCTVALGALPSWLAAMACAPFSIIASLTNIIPSIGQASAVFSTTAIFTYMNYILTYGLYIIIQMILFVLDLIIMYPLVDNIARSLGGSIRLSLGGKLRLAS